MWIGHTFYLFTIQYIDMIKANFKNVAFSLAVLFAVLVCFIVLDGAMAVNAANSKTLLRVTVVDLYDQPVHGAEVSVCDLKFLTDNKGLSPTIELPVVENGYDSSITDWFAVNVTVTKDGYVPTVVVNCVVYCDDTRKLTVKIYPKDGSDLPYVCYVESPPSDYLKSLIENS